MVLIIIFFVLLVLFIVLSVIYFKRSNAIIKTTFENSSTYTFGAKGKGKDLLYQKVIHLRKIPYYSNIYYGGFYKHLSLKAMNVDPNTYHNMIVNDVKGINTYLLEQCDLYISDAGIYLPNFEDAKLNKEYPSMPIFMAVQRHILSSNTHVNSQAYGRVWKKVREQADFYIKALRVIKLGRVFLCKIRIYDKESSAENDMRPLRKKLFKKNLETAEDYYAKNGTIIERYYIILKKHIKYDTRAFKRIFKIYD